MSNQPAPTSPNPLPGEVPDKRDFKKVWEDAVKSYNAGTQPKKKQHHRPGLISPPVDYRTADQVIKHFESQKELFKVFRSSGEKVRGVLTPIVDILLVLKEGAESASDLVTGGDTILGAIGSLLEATKGVSELYDAVEALLKEVLASLKRFKIHFEEPATPRATLKNIIVDALVQVLMVLALATKYCNLAVAGVPWYKRVLRVFWRRAKDYFLVLTDKADVQGILEELRTLANKEEQLVIAATHADGRETKANVAVVKSNVDVVKSDVEIVKPKVAYVHNKAVIDDLRLWLRPPNEQPSNYERKRQTGSCEWFFDENYEDWKAHGNKVYWVHGNPGAGKSVLSSSVIDKVGMDPTLSLAYFYFDFSDLTKQDCVALASSLVFQLGTTCSQECLNYLQRERTNSPPNYDKLLAMLSRLLALSGRTFIIVDALDECPEPARNDDKLLRLLKHLCDQVDGDTDLHLLITSRPAIDIRERISPRATYSLSFHNEVRHTTELARFISTQVSTNKPKWWSVQLQQQVQEKLYERSTGMYVIVLHGFEHGLILWQVPMG
ncbi:hypothetical protein PENSPDRAFT_361100 [Peniophora sp. CONT]|nr:hypothetical protein PENSPDRAFT_361100 [Peniophora sp. CONT]